MSSRIIFVFGGVMSGIGKGITTAALGSLLKAKGYKVTAIKIDPYINVDAGTMNPVEHGEVFVTKDGLETDQDIGNYERFLDQELSAANSLTTGQVYLTVIERERSLYYKGRVVEAVPDIPEEVIRRIEVVCKDSQADFVIVEVGGTAGEYQNLVYFEAARLMRLANPNHVAFILVSYVPTPSTLGEMKTKPTQYAVRTLNETGIQPDFVVTRANGVLDEPRKEKIAHFCNVARENIIAAPDCASIYEVPLLLEKEQFGAVVLKHFGLKDSKSDLKTWELLAGRIRKAKREVRIGIVGKYFKSGDFNFSDSYISVIEALRHASWALGLTPKIDWLDALDYVGQGQNLNKLNAYDGLIVPGGFGSRGVEGKIACIRYAREQKVPFLGLCYGMQMACIEFGRHVLGLKGANTIEVDPKTKHPIFNFLPNQSRLTHERHFGGTMRLGDYSCELIQGSLSAALYKKRIVTERHRHRYEFNNKYLTQFKKAGIICSGLNPKLNVVEIIELKDHPFFIGTQFHPEFKTRPLMPHPLFLGFVEAAAQMKKQGRAPAMF